MTSVTSLGHFVLEAFSGICSNISSNSVLEDIKLIVVYPVVQNKCEYRWWCRQPERRVSERLFLLWLWESHLLWFSVIDFLYFHFSSLYLVLFYVYECLHEWISAHHVHVVLEKARRGRHIFLGLESQPHMRGHEGAKSWTLPLDEQPVFSTAQISFQLPHFILSLKKKLRQCLSM